MFTLPAAWQHQYSYTDNSQVTCMFKNDGSACQYLIIDIFYVIQYVIWFYDKKFRLNTIKNYVVEVRYCFLVSFC